MRSDKCPKCGKSIKAHQGNTKNFDELTPVEQERSIRMMAINLKRAIRVSALDDIDTMKATTIDVIRQLIRGF